MTSQVDYMGDVKIARSIVSRGDYYEDSDEDWFILWLRCRGLLMVSFPRGCVAASLTMKSGSKSDLSAMGLDLRHALALLVSLVHDATKPKA